MKERKKRVNQRLFQRYSHLPRSGHAIEYIVRKKHLIIALLQVYFRFVLPLFFCVEIFP